jgi:hypothetical protein
MNYTNEQIDLIVEHCQPEFSTWWSEWLEKNNQNEITSENVFDCLSDNFDDVDLYIQENIL